MPTWNERTEPSKAFAAGTLSFRLLSIVLGCLVGAVLGELLLRLVPVGGTQYKNTSLYTQHQTPQSRPDFRQRPYRLDKSPGTFRILVVGDSFTWGTGVYSDDTYPDRLQRRLNALEPEVPIEVIAWARPGWNTEQELEAVREELPRLQPDLMILSFVFNDPEPSVYLERNERQKAFARRQPTGRLTTLLYRRSRLYHTPFDRFENVRQRRNLTAFYHDSFRDGPAWRACVRALVGFRSLTQKKSVPLLLVVFPIFDSELDESYPYRDLHQAVQRTAEGLDIPLLDLLPTFDGMEARRLAVVPFTDAHPNELAHRIASDRLMLYLLEQDLVPVEPPPSRRWYH